MMFNGGGNGISLADIAAVAGRGNNGGYGDGFGGGGWWAIIILLFLCGGFDGNGFGNGNGRSAAATTQAEVQRGFDTSGIISKLDGINNGICSLGYDQLAQMNNINNNITQMGFGVQNAITQSTIANMQNTNALSTQISNCCCENRQGQADIKYAMATDTCAITTAINQMAQNIMQNDNANYRQLHDENVQLQMQAYRDQIAAKDQLITSLNLAQSQANQNQFFQNQIENLYDRLSPCPSPAYWVPNPNANYGAWGPFSCNTYNNGYNNCNSGCGANSCCA